MMPIRHDRSAHARRGSERYYVGRCVSDAINEIAELRKKLGLPV
jgi:hypothetical protein